MDASLRQRCAARPCGARQDFPTVKPTLREFPSTLLVLYLVVVIQALVIIHMKKMKLFLKARESLTFPSSPREAYGSSLRGLFRQSLRWFPKHPRILTRLLHDGLAPSASGNISSVMSDVGLSGPVFGSDRLDARPSLKVALDNERLTLEGEFVKNLAGHM